MNTTLRVSLELDDVHPALLAQVAHDTAYALTRTFDVESRLQTDDWVLRLRFDSLNRHEAERTRDCVVGAIRPLVKRVIGTHLRVS